MDTADAVGRDNDPLVSTTDSSPPTTETIARAIASALDERPTEIPPLYDTVDTNAIERILGTNTSGQVTFRYEGLYVTAAADGTVEVYDDGE